MKKQYTRNQKIFLMLNIATALVVALFLFGNDFAIIHLLFFFFLLLNVVYSLAFFATYKSVKKSLKNLFLISISVIVNCLTYIMLIYSALQLF